VTTVAYSPRMTRTYLVQSHRDEARDRAIALATDANSRVHVGRGGAVKPAKGKDDWWLVTLRLREERR
jgi:hypothetical protein